jgi:hypothetical protein
MHMKFVTPRSVLRILMPFLLGAALASCGQPPAAPATATSAPPTSAPAATSAPTTMPTTAATSAPAATTAATTAPADTATATAPAATSAPTSAPGDGEPTYLDDRSGPAEAIRSLYNAINRREYARAYSYWQPGADVPAFAEFEQGYADTKHVDLTLGTITGDAGAGQLYFSAPVTLQASSTDGGQQTYVGCYVLHQSNPGIPTEPPFRPLAIQSGKVQLVQPGADTAALMAGACENAGQGLPPVTPGDRPGSTDNRSTPEDVIRSLYDAINGKQYVRAYSYWQNPQTSFEAFQQGYADTTSVEVVLGASQVGAAAGNRYYMLPVVLHATKNDGTRQTYAGCYQLHLAVPTLQSPPFQPLGISAADIQPVDSPDATPQPVASCAGR